MSDPNYIDPALIALIVAKFEEMIIENCCAVAGIALLSYDCLLTFRREVDCIWARKSTAVTILYMINRYVPILTGVLGILQMFPWPPETPGIEEVCTTLLRLDQGLSIVFELAIIATLILRTFVISQKNWKILVWLLMLGCIAPVSNVFYYSHVIGGLAPYPFYGCGIVSDPTLSRNGIAILIAFGDCFDVFFNAAVVGLTWYQTATISRSIKELNINSSIIMLLHRDGIVYFILLLMFSIIHMISIRYPVINNVTSISNAATSILISRFMLNLRSIIPHRHDDESPSFLQVTQNPDRFLGNIGASVDTGFEQLVEAGAETEDSENRDEDASYSHHSFSVALPDRFNELGRFHEEFEEDLSGIKPIVAV